MKDVIFHGNSLSKLRDFPDDAKDQAGFQLHKVQSNERPDDWIPMPAIGLGVHEIRIHTDDGAFRVIYVAKFADAVHVLHAFRRQMPETAEQDIDIAQTRYRELNGSENNVRKIR
jgi:phage-related protein